MDSYLSSRFMLTESQKGKMGLPTIRSSLILDFQFADVLAPRGFIDVESGSFASDFVDRSGVPVQRPHILRVDFVAASKSTLFGAREIPQFYVAGNDQTSRRRRLLESELHLGERGRVHGLS